MFKKMVSYCVSLLVISFIVAGIASFAMEYVPYVLLTMVMTAPFYGAVRMKMNWNAGMFSLLKVLKFRKVSITFLLVGGIVSLMLYKVILVKLAIGTLFALGGAAVAFISWESIRFALNKWKAIQIVSFVQAFKKAW